MTNINIIIVKPNTGDILTDVYLQPVTISQFDQVKLNVNLNGFTNSQSVSMSFKFPNGQELHDLHLVNSVGTPNLYSLQLTQAFTNNLNVGAQTAVQITNITVTDEVKQYQTSVIKTFNLYKTNTSSTYTPDDIQILFVKINELNKKISELENSTPEASTVDLSGITSRLEALETLTANDVSGNSIQDRLSTLEEKTNLIVCDDGSSLYLPENTFIYTAGSELYQVLPFDVSSADWNSYPNYLGDYDYVANLKVVKEGTAYKITAPSTGTSPYDEELDSSDPGSLF